MADLCVECHLLIIEKLDLPELINVAATNRYFRTLSFDVFSRKYAKLSIVFRRSVLANVENFQIGPSKEVRIEDYNLMFKILNNFGNLMVTLKIEYLNFGSKRISVLNHYINNRCSDSIIHLELRNYPYNNVLDVIQMPFKNAESVSFGFERITNSVMTLDEMFPKMRRLDLNNVRIVDASFIERRFNQLEDFSLSFVTSEGLDQEGIKNVIKANPQIRSLQLAHSSENLLKFISENLPQLEELQLSLIKWNTNMEGDMIHFKKVKKFLVRTTKNSPRKLIFDNLQELVLDCSDQISIEWMNFVVNNRNLTKIETLYGSLNDWQLNMFGENLTNLKEATIICGSNVQIETISKFIKNNLKLEILKLSRSIIPRFGQLRENSLRRKFEGEWNIRNMFYGYLFEKKCLN